jgi:hypothetical protein
MTSSALDAALRFAAAGVPVFPCAAAGPMRKRPLTPRGFHDATTDPTIITAWWRRWPDALIGAPTGRVSGWIVLDIDVKRSEANGFDSLEDLGHSILPQTPMVHTPSGGLHTYFDAGDRELKCSAGLLGPGLDVRSDGGYIIVPPSRGYEWDPLYNFTTVALLPAPDWLWPPKPARSTLPLPPIKPTSGLSPYGEAAIEGACDAIVHAPAGEQERTLNAEAFSIGSLAGAGIVPADVALRALLRAGSAMPDHDVRWPWRPEEIDLKVRRAFNAGLQQPREARRGQVA